MALRGRLGCRGADHDLYEQRNDPRRQMLISLLMTGSTDSAIANTLNINVRSVRRWISDLMDELGSFDSSAAWCGTCPIRGFARPASGGSRP